MWPSRLPKNPGTLVGIDKMPVDLEILKKMSDYNIDLEYAFHCIEANRKNHASATYYLLLKSHLKEGGKSITDARNTKYDPKIFTNLKRSQKFRKLVKRDTSVDMSSIPAPKIIEEQNLERNDPKFQR